MTRSISPVQFWTCVVRLTFQSRSNRGVIGREEPDNIGLAVQDETPGVGPGEAHLFEPRDRRVLGLEIARSALGQEGGSAAPGSFAKDELVLSHWPEALIGARSP